MKKSTTLFSRLHIGRSFLVVMTFALLLLSGCNEKKNEPANPDTPETNVPVQSVTLSRTSCAFNKIGAEVQLEAKVLPENASNPKITWQSSNTDIFTVSENGLLTCTGFGIATLTATADDKSATCTIVAEKDLLTDICGNMYIYVTIGSQVWMAENMRCEKYDTESERTGAILSTSSDATYAPYYADASDKSLWDSKSLEYGAKLTSGQIEKLGYLYNWAAAVGIATAEDAKAQNSEFSTNRQGICPNGWHVPTNAEWDALGEALGGTKESNGIFPKVGRLLKTKSGWYDDNNGNGTDAYSFAALPAGEASGCTVYDVGRETEFCMSTPRSFSDANRRYLSYGSVDFHIFYGFKSYAQSVRCIKN